MNYGEICTWSLVIDHRRKRDLVFPLNRPKLRLYNTLVAWSKLVNLLLEVNCSPKLRVPINTYSYYHTHLHTHIRSVCVYVCVRKSRCVSEWRSRAAAKADKRFSFPGERHQWAGGRGSGSGHSCACRHHPASHYSARWSHTFASTPCRFSLPENWILLSLEWEQHTLTGVVPCANTLSVPVPTDWPHDPT